MIDADDRQTTRQPRSLRYIGAFLFLWAGAITWGVLPIPAVQAAPRATVRETSFDFGKITEDRALSQQSGPYAGLIELFTTSKKRPRLIVRVFRELYLPSAAGQ